MAAYLYQTISSTLSPYLEFAKAEYSVSAKVCHPNKLPLATQRVDLAAKIWLFEIPLGTFYTDSDGNLNAKYKWIKLPYQSNQTLSFKIYQNTYGINDIVVHNPEVLVSNVARSIPLGNRVKINDIEVKLFECEAGLPVLSAPNDTQQDPQQTDVRDLIELARVAVVPQTVQELIDFLGKITGKTLSQTEVETIQQVYSKKELNPANVIDIVLNGICPNLKKMANSEDYVSEVKWDGFELTQENAIPNGKLIAGKDQNGKFGIKEIILQYRGQEPVSYTPTSSDFEKALFKFNSIAFISGSSAYHLGTHFEVGQYAIAAFRTLKNNPIGKLIIPHLEGVLEINSKAATIIVNILALSGLTQNGVWQQIGNSLGGRCYSNFVPPVPLSETHRAAHASDLFYRLVNDIVENFFNQHANDIENNWSEIFYLSQTLVDISAPYSAWDGRFDARGAEDRAEINGVKKAIRPITLLKAKPAAVETDHIVEFYEDMQKLKQFCKYVIYQATWGHWVLHINEIEGIDPQFARIAPETASEAQKADADNQQISLVKTLCGFQFGALVKNPNGDIPQDTIDALINPEVVKYFQVYGYDINKVFRGVII